MSWLSDDVVEHLRRIAPWPDLSGTRYTPVDVIARGGMGTVYLARDEELGRDVALKVSNAATTHTELETRMRREARVLARLEHPGIVPIHDAGALPDGRSYYVMKRVDGVTLSEHTRASHSTSDLLGVFERICEPVAFAHSRGVIHRDLKPENIMVGSFGEVLVMDWGVAKLLDDPHDSLPAPVPDDAAARPEDPPAPAGPTSPSLPVGAAEVTPVLTDPGTVMGTPGYMPPEQAFGLVESVDRRADVYALGAILLHMLTGSPPANPSAGPRSAPREAAIPKRLRAIIRKATSAEPGERYASAAELAEDVARYRAGESVSAYRETILDRLGRFATTYRAAIFLVLAYLLMRLIVAVIVG